MEESDTMDNTTKRSSMQEFCSKKIRNPSCTIEENFQDRSFPTRTEINRQFGLYSLTVTNEDRYIDPFRRIENLANELGLYDYSGDLIIDSKSISDFVCELSSTVEISDTYTDRIMNADERKIATSAYTDFCNKKYTLCLQHLSLLTSLKPNNLKILHNKAVVELYASGYKNIDVFQKSLSSLCTQGHIKILESDSPGDMDHCIIYYNQAVLYYYQKQYETALIVLSKVFSLIQPMEEWLATQICFLLLELCLLCNQADKGLIHISFIENQFLTMKVLDGSSEENAHKRDWNEMFKSNLLLYKAKCLIFTKSYNEAKTKLDLIFSPVPQSCVENFSCRMLKGQALFLSKHYQEALDEIIIIQEDIDGFEKLGDDRTLIYFNNIAVVYHLLKKNNISAFFLNKAINLFLTTFPKIKKNPQANFGAPMLFQPSTYLNIVYNKGLVLLNNRKPNEAFDCFTESLQGMHRSPLVWLRIVECCIMVYKKDNSEFFNFCSKRNELVSETIGTGNNATIILNNKIYKDTAFSSESQSFAVPVPTLEFATICLRNSLVLLQQKPNKKLQEAVLAAAAYVHLKIGDPVLSYKHSKLLLAEATSHLYKYLGRLYLGESLVMLNRFEESLDVLNPSHFSECDPTKDLPNSDWAPNSQITSQAILNYNLAVVCNMNGDFEKASELLKQIWMLKGPKNEVPIHVIALALHIEISLGHLDIARTILKQNCPQNVPK